MGTKLSGEAAEYQEMELNIPDDILLEIFARVEPRDLARTVPRVCQKWRTMSNLATLWKRLCVVSGRFYPGYMPEPDSFKELYFYNPFTRNH